MNLKAKYNGTPEVSPERPRHELEIMNEWLSQHRQNEENTNEKGTELPSRNNLPEQYMDSNPDFTKYFYMGIAFFESGQYKDSVVCFGKALRINPKHKEALKYLLKAFYYVRKDNRALA